MTDKLIPVMVLFMAATLLHACSMFRDKQPEYLASEEALSGRDVVAKFDGGTITSDAGALLLRELEAATGILQQFAACFTDHRNPELIEHTVAELVAQRVYSLALGYEAVALTGLVRVTSKILQMLRYVVRGSLVRVHQLRRV